VAEQVGRRFRVTRRGLLIGAGVTGVGLAVGVAVGRKPFYRVVAGLLAGGFGPGEGSDDPALWFEVLPDDRVRIIIPKVEMGQGVHTALAQIAASELGARFDQLDVVQGGTHLGPPDGMGKTAGSLSIATLWLPLRRAAALLREMLLMRAAEALGSGRGRLVVAEGSVRGPDGAITFGEIVALGGDWPEPDADPELRDLPELELVGKPVPRVDFADKLSGKPVYSYDMSADGMLYGAVVRPPTIQAQLRKAAPGTAPAQPGVERVVIEEGRGFVGVVARTRHQAAQALQYLELDWDLGHPFQQAEIDGLLRVEDGAGASLQRKGEVARVLAAGPILESEYQTPLAAHAQLEPRAALADVRDERVRVVASTQIPGSIQSDVAEALGFAADQIEVTPAYMGGSFGRGTGTKAAVEAALLSQAVGRPVHVGWTRSEEMKHGYFRPPTRSRFRARIEGGRIAALQHNHSSGSVFLGDSRMLWFLGADPGAWKGSYNRYRIPNHELNSHTAMLPVATGPWRGLGLFPNVFATESFMDEMAFAAGVDPLRFRLAHLGDDDEGRRFAGVLEAVAERSGYGQPLPAGRARGIACCSYHGTVVALVVEISIAKDGEIRVHRATEAVDPGLVINPDGAVAQAQGSIVMGLSSTLIEEISIKDGAVEAANFDAYPLLTMDRTPEIDVVLLESGDTPTGMGEPPIGPVAAAVGNAFFNAKGVRLRRLPFTPARVRTALES
jgi:isoquinoline 1-oxidoreductase beta subunit